MRGGHDAIVAERTGARANGSHAAAAHHIVSAMDVDQARVVVIGGGITGCSVAYHLALAGWTDVLLIEKAQLTAGSTCQAAGLVTAFNPSSTMMQFRRYSIELYQRLGAFETVGSLRLASSREQLLELERTASRARGIGLDADVIGAEEARRLMPAISQESLYGAVHLASDGHLDPHGATHAVAGAARSLGVRIRAGVRVTGFELSARREITAVLTDAGRIATELVVNAAGIWAPQVAAMIGAFIPSTPVDHQHIALKAVPGHELPREMPCFRDPANLVYGKSEHGGMVFGGYETNPVSRWEDGVPWEHAARSLPADYERFAPLMAGAIRRFPFLADAEAIRLVCHPDAMTPDANPLLGPLPGVRGLWAAAGLSLNGFGGAGGIGRALAGWITAGDPGLDIGPYRAWRFADVYRDPGFAAGLAREAYSDYYRLRYPFDADVAGRPRRLSALHGRLQEAGAVFGTKAGWERADYFEPGRPWRRAGRDQAAYGWTRPPWFERVALEAQAVRERAGIIDLSSFGKIGVDGPGALGLLQGISANDVDRAVGAVVYTQFCDERGGMVADVTVTRLAEDRFRVVTGAGYLASDMAWLRASVDWDDGVVQIRDVSGELTTVGLWGPRARDVLAAASDDDVSDVAIPLRHAREINLGGAPVLAARISYAGELGWELTMDACWAVTVWDRLRAAGEDRGLEPFGYRALESLRLEKGYRYFGTDLTMLETPFEAGLGAFVRFDKGPFVGRDALIAARDAAPDGPARRLRSVLIGGSDYLPIFGGEAVRLAGAVIGRLRSVAYGPTVSRTIGTLYCSASLGEGSDLQVDVFDERIPAVIAAEVLVDPRGERMRG
ncbi:MAG: FAD-dependent oxidoreductase [Candidatus Limnocylindrales bacterium]|nr:FAD-dependent oxidoreductase [Candidatus Limnocylindrales bacterium]